MSSVTVVFVDPGGYRMACLLTGGEVVATQQLELHVELNASLTALSSAEPVRPMDWVTPADRHASTNRLPAAQHVGCLAGGLVWFGGPASPACAARHQILLGH